MDILYESSISVWLALIDETTRMALIRALESGHILYFSRLAFTLNAAEARFLSPHWLDGSRKNISCERGGVSGARGSAEEQRELAAMLERFSGQALQLVHSLFPRYAPHLQIARASFRPAALAARATSWRKDDSRLHVDAFPSRPNHGGRILRVFSNVNPQAARVWRIGEPFATAAGHFMPRIRRPWPGSARLLNTLGITKSRRSEYDHIMLRLHDAMKADAEYQRDAGQREVVFAPCSTWICFSDQVVHAAVTGQHLFEQTLHLPVSAQYHPERSPLQTLERLCGRALA